MTALSDAEFAQFRRFIHAEAGISLADSKKALVSGRLGTMASDDRVEVRRHHQRLRDPCPTPG